jgi:O-acetyl-ADP-ribose deacetylase
MAFMGFHIRIQQGNLLEEAEADFIVNPSNTRLLLGSGVSGAFARACGDTLQQAMTRKLRETGPLSKGEVVPTPPGGCVRFRTVLHAAVMDYNPGAVEAMPTLNDIKVILNNIEAILSAYAAGRTGRIRLVMPLMGTGVGGLDKRDVIRIYRDFFRRESTYECEVVLYAHSQNDFELMTSLLDA